MHPKTQHAKATTASHTLSTLPWQGSLWTPPSPRRRPSTEGEALSRLAPAQAAPSSEARARASQELTRRLIVADWVRQIAEVRLPTATDSEFRQALRDGVTLCRILNTVRPGSVRKVPPPGVTAAATAVLVGAGHEGSCLPRLRSLGQARMHSVARSRGHEERWPRDHRPASGWLALFMHNCSSGCWRQHVTAV